MTGHVYQEHTFTRLRREYTANLRDAEGLIAQGRQLIESAARYAALAHDYALLLEVSDPEWTAECEAPIVTRMLRLRAWREMIDFLEAHPEIGIDDHELLTIEQPDGTHADAGFIAALEQIGFEVEQSEAYGYIRGELWFGGRAVGLRAHARVEVPADVAPVDDEGQADESAEQLVDPLSETAARTPAADPSPRAESPIKVNDRVRVHAAAVGDGDEESGFPPELDGHEGIVTEVASDAFTADRETSDSDDQPIDVLLDGEQVPRCFAVAEVEVLTPVERRPEAMDRLIGQPA